MTFSYIDGDGVEIDTLATNTAKFGTNNDGKVTGAKEIAFAFFTENEDDTDLEALREVFDSNSDY